MVIRGNIRGNGAQLAQYLLGEGGNERIQLLEVDGREDASEHYLHQTLLSMSLTAQLSRTDKGLYHAQINPAYSEDRRMSTEDWQRAADILGHELGLSEQRRVIVLHTKKNRTHAHVVFERYDHQTGKVIDNRFSRLAQDRARKEMERVFEHAPTPHRNQHRPELKDLLTTLWQENQTGQAFINAVHDNGYLLAHGVPRHPFMVVDENGRSFDLVRQLKGIRIKEVRQRLRDLPLLPEKEAIQIMRERQESTSNATSGQRPQVDVTTDHSATERVVHLEDMPHHQPQHEPLNSREQRLADFMHMGHEQTAEQDRNDSLEQKKRVASAFIATSDELTGQREDETRAEAVHQPTAQDANLSESSTRPLETDCAAPDETKEGDEPTATGEQDILTDVDIATVNRYRQTLADFLIEQHDRLSPGYPAESNTQRQRDKAQQFFANEDLTTSKAVDNEEERQRLMQEQKESRERRRHRAKRRNR
ncbi:relaxase/mobilization nuclease domain-containing protein [Fibrella sp. WM1]|uniref:relaxase/mobilization nuclease domain-containing protein n=1 Tax=Fibrella musci TaxID=3242485 RepID=UPI003521159A